MTATLKDVTKSKEAEQSAEQAAVGLVRLASSSARFVGQQVAHASPSDTGRTLPIRV